MSLMKLSKMASATMALALLCLQLPANAQSLPRREPTAAAKKTDIAAKERINAWTVGLADLASRLRAIPAVTLSPPDDALLRAVLVKLFADRQIKTDESLVTYLLARLERSFAAARAAVDAIDREALRRKRPVTQALAADVLEVQWELGLSGGESDAP